MKYSLHAFMSMQSFCIYHIYLRRRILFLIYQFQFLSLCHSREDEDIPKNSGRCHSSRPSLTSLIPSSSHTPLVNRCKHKMQVALFFKTSFRRPGHSSPMERNSFPEASKQSEQNNKVLSQESNNNFLYIWQTGFCIFSHPILRSQVNFISLNLSLCGFVCVSFSSQNRSAVFPMVVHFVLTIQTR